MGILSAIIALAVMNEFIHIGTGVYMDWITLVVGVTVMSAISAIGVSYVRSGKFA